MGTVARDEGDHLGPSAVIYVKAALAFFSIVNWIMQTVDEARREEILSALWDQDFMKRDKEIINRANRVRDAVAGQLRDNPDGLRAPDQFERT